MASQSFDVNEYPFAPCIIRDEESGKLTPFGKSLQIASNISDEIFEKVFNLDQSQGEWWNKYTEAKEVGIANTEEIPIISIHSIPKLIDACFLYRCQKEDLNIPEGCPLAKNENDVLNLFASAVLDYASSLPSTDELSFLTELMRAQDSKNGTIVQFGAAAMFIRLRTGARGCELFPDCESDVVSQEDFFNELVRLPADLAADEEFVAALLEAANYYSGNEYLACLLNAAGDNPGLEKSLVTAIEKADNAHSPFAFKGDDLVFDAVLLVQARNIEASALTQVVSNAELGSVELVTHMRAVIASSNFGSFSFCKDDVEFWKNAEESLAFLERLRNWKKSPEVFGSEEAMECIVKCISLLSEMVGLTNTSFILRSAADQFRDWFCTLIKSYSRNLFIDYAAQLSVARESTALTSLAISNEKNVAIFVEVENAPGRLIAFDVTVSCTGAVDGGDILAASLHPWDTDGMKRVNGGEKTTFLIEALVSQDALNAGSFTLPLTVSYSEYENGSNVVRRSFDTEVHVYLENPREKALRNPYKRYCGGNPIMNSNDKMFYGRKTEKKEIVGLLESDGIPNYGHSIAIYGQTRTGKSSLLYQACHEIRERYGEKVLICDMGNIGTIQSSADEPERFLAEFLFNMLDELSNAIEDNDLLCSLVDTNATMPPFEMLDNPSRAPLYFHKIMRRLGKVLSTQGMVLFVLIDEFTYIHNLLKTGQVNEGFMRFWKAFLQNYPVCAVVVGQDDMQEFINEYPNEFACMRPLKITYLDKESALSLVQDPVNGVDEECKVISDDAADVIIRMTAGSPFLTMRLCSRVVDFVNEYSLNTVKGPIIDVIASRFAQELRAPDFEPLLKERGHSKYDEKIFALLGSIAHYANKTGFYPRADNIQCDDVVGIEREQLLQRLVDRDVLKYDAGRYAIKVELLRIWFSHRAGVK